MIKTDDETPTISYQKFDIDWLQKFEGFENVTQEESKEIITTLEKLADIIYNHFHKAQITNE